MAKLALTANGMTIRWFTLDEEQLTIGREPDNVVMLDDDTVSGYHAEIVSKPSQYMEGSNDYWIRDLQSTNGIQVNGQRTKRALLKNGDEIEIGVYQFKLIDEAKGGSGRTTRLIID